MFTSTVHRFYGSTRIVMQRHNEVQCQSHDTGMACISEGGVRSQSCAKGITWMGYEHSDMHFMKIMPENIRHSYVITFQTPEE